MGKGQPRVCAALDPLGRQRPCRLQGIDSDHGAEFINAHLYRYCHRRRIQFTRGRPYKKDDEAHIAQQNWTHVRKLVGYVRYDSPAALSALYDDLRLLQNLWRPPVKLVKKPRVGGRLRRQYNAAQTPFDRVRACPEADPVQAAALRRPSEALDPCALAAGIDQPIGRPYPLANDRRGPSTIAPVDAAGPVENAQSLYPTRSLENPQSGFSTATTGPSSSRSAKKKTTTSSVTRLTAP